MAYCKAGTGAISIGFHGSIKKRLSRVEGKAVFACQSLFRAGAAMRRRFLYACELSAGAAAVLAGFNSGTGACARGRSGGGAMRFYCGVSAKAMGKPFMHGKGLPLTPTPHRHSGTRKDLTGSDMRRPHCGWPVRSGCIDTIPPRSIVQTRAAFKRRGVGLTRAKRCACRLSLLTSAWRFLPWQGLRDGRSWPRACRGRAGRPARRA